MSPNLEVSKAAAAEIDMEKVGQETTATDKPEIDDEPEEEEQGEKEVYPPWKRVAVIMAALYCTMFIVALDRTILGTAIPKITDDFHSINDVGNNSGTLICRHSGTQVRI